LINRKSWLKQVFSQIILKVLLAVVVLTLCNFAFTYLITYSAGTSLANILLNIITTFITYLIWIILYFAYHYVDSYNTSLKYEAVKNEIELNKLKSQLNPHFIFNALNSIRALVDEDPDKCKNAITQLSNILRNSLIMDKKKLTDFAEEMQTVKDYLALETIRFEERLRSEIILHPGSGKFKVPPLMIQTLVENGIKHGISHLKDGGIVSVETNIDKDEMTILIRNSGQYVNGNVREGYGISNTKQRLNLLFGNQASFRIFNENENFVITEVKIPRYV
jgi:LytS/YehU family sensor histidine kinase